MEHTQNEKNILFSIHCNFIVRLYDYFQDTKSLYFILEFVNGGEMFTHIQKQPKRRFTEEQVGFCSQSLSLLLFKLLSLLVVTTWH